MDGPKDFNRNAEFKKGISGKTQKRHDRQISIRKGKKEEKLLRRRRDATDALPNSQFQAYLNAFNPEALKHRNLDALKHLRQLVAMATEQQIERHIMPNILPYIPILIKYCEHTAPQDIEYVACALSCLVNLTATQLAHDQKLAIEIFKAGFVSRTAPTMLVLFYQGKNGCMSVEVRKHLWDLVSNLVLTSKEARNDVLKSPIVDNGNPKAPFFQELFLLYDEKHTNDAVRCEIVPQMIYTIAAILQNTEIDTPHLFCFGLWPFLQRMIQDHQTRDFSTAEYLYNSVYLILRIQYRRDVRDNTCEMARMILASDMNSMLVRMKELFRKTTNQNIKICLVQICTYISGIPIGEGTLQKLFAATGWATLMVECTDNINQNIRESSFLFLGNFMSDGTPYVRGMMEHGVVSSIINKLQRERYEQVRYNALYAFMLMFKACDEDRRTMDGKMREAAEGVMRTLVVEKTMFNYIIPYITREGSSTETILYALDMLKTGLQWNRELVLDMIQNVGEDALNVLMNKLNNSKGAQDTRLYDLACQVDDLLSNDTRMDLDEGYFKGAEGFFNF